MSLDLAVLHDDGTPGVTVAVNAEAHARIMNAARGLALPLLLRLADYFQDARFALGELPALDAELTTASRHVAADAELVALLDGLRALVAAALKSRKGIAALAD